MPANKSQVRFLFTLLAVVWGFLVGANSLLAAWSTPTAVPPGSQPEPFLSTDNNSQTKTGALTIANDFYVIGRVGMGTNTATSARLVIAPRTDVAINNASIDAGSGYISTGWSAVNGNDAVNRNYLISTIEASLDPIKYWTLSGSNLYASSTAYKVAIGTTTAGTAKLAVIGGNVGIGTTTPVDKLQVYGNTFLGRISGYPYKSLWTWESDNTGYAAGIGYQKNDDTNQKLFVWWRDSVVETNINSVLNVATPGHTFDGTHPNTGRTIGVSLSASGASYFTGGNVGIGTTTPNSRLFVKGLGSASTTSALNIQNSSGVSSLFVRNDGYIGIGTTSPTVSLYVNGYAIANTPTDSKHLATKGYVDTAAQSLWINSGSFLYASSTSWRVGIGTTSPASALHIYPQNNIEGLRVVSSNYSPLVISTAAGVDLFRVNQYGDATAVTSSATRMRSNNYCDASGNNCFDPSSGWSSAGYFATVTTATYSGNNNNNPGYAFAHARCNDQLAGTHVCSAEEILNTIRENDPNKPMPTVDVWIFNGPPGYTAMANDCDGRRSNIGSGTNTAYGSYWQMSDSVYLPHGRGLLYTCEKSLKFACCK